LVPKLSFLILYVLIDTGMFRIERAGDSGSRKGRRTAHSSFDRRLQESGEQGGKLSGVIENCRELAAPSASRRPEPANAGLSISQDPAAPNVPLDSVAGVPCIRSYPSDDGASNALVERPAGAACATPATAGPSHSQRQNAQQLPCDNVAEVLFTRVSSSDDEALNALADLLAGKQPHSTGGCPHVCAVAGSDDHISSGGEGSPAEGAKDADREHDSVCVCAMGDVLEDDVTTEEPAAFRPTRLRRIGSGSAKLRSRARSSSSEVVKKCTKKTGDDGAQLVLPSSGKSNSVACDGLDVLHSGQVEALDAQMGAVDDFPPIRPAHRDEDVTQRNRDFDWKRNANVKKRKAGPPSESRSGFGGESKTHGGSTSVGKPQIEGEELARARDQGLCKHLGRRRSSCCCFCRILGNFREFAGHVKGRKSGPHLAASSAKVTAAAKLPTHLGLVRKAPPIYIHRSSTHAKLNATGRSAGSKGFVKQATDDAMVLSAADSFRCAHLFKSFGACFPFLFPR
jgi:hypothetical protein